VAVVEKAYCEGQRVTYATAATVARVAKERGVQAPACLLIGDVVTALDRDQSPGLPPDGAVGQSVDVGMCGPDGVGGPDSALGSSEKEKALALSDLIREAL
jgi:hypothetical protein